MLKPVALLHPLSLPARPSEAPEGLSAAKLEPPPVTPAAVTRHVLLARLEQARSVPLCLLQAPPGYGKTLALVQWRRHLLERGERVAWLSLEEEDADPERLLAYLALALQQAGAPAERCAPLLERGRGGVAGLLLAARSAPQRITLLLDDYDRAGCAAVDDVVQRLVEHADPQLRLVLASRRAPTLPLARWSLQGRVLRLESDALALDEAETQHWLGQEFPPACIAELRQRTEGWPVALQLARLWLQADPGRVGQLSAFSGRLAALAAYLAEQVVADLAADARDLLLRTAPLERFNVALADHVRAEPGSGQVLQQLQHFQGLLVPLDHEHEWFRQHPLLAEYLQQQLERLHPGQTARIHLAAARWLGEHGHLPEAVRHAARAGDSALAATYVARAGTWQLLLDHGVPQVCALLQPFAPRTVRDTPALNLTQAYLHMKLGEFGHARLLLERFRDFPAQQREPLQRDYTLVVALLRDLLDEIAGTPRGLAQLSAQLQALDEDDHLGRGTLACICATTALGQEELVQAERHARAASAAMLRSERGGGLGAGYALLHLAQSLFLRGRLGEAEATCHQAQEQVRGSEHGDRTVHAAAQVLLAQVQYEHGRFDRAADLLEPALSYLEVHDGWFELFAIGYETALALARGADPGGRQAQAVLERVERTAQGRRLSRLAELGSIWRLQLALEQPTPAGIDPLVARTGGDAGFAHAMRQPERWRQRAALGFALARWHRLGGRASQALAILRQLEQACLASDNRQLLLRTRARIALVLQQRGELDEAACVLHAVLDPVGLTQSWQAVVELGTPAKAMLRSLRQHDAQIASGTTRALTVQALLDRLSDGEEAHQDEFSERELEVLAQLALGHSNKHIARRLSLSENTVKFHLKNLYRKLQASNRDAALALARQRGLFKP